MSIMRTETIKCPGCGQDAEYVMWDSINTQMDPDMKGKVRTGEAFTFTCPHCGYSVTYSYPTLYHQMEDNVMIYLAPGGVEEALDSLKKSKEIMADSPAGGLDMPEYMIRVVETRNQFVEKLKILDAGLDDRILEIMKIIYLGQFTQQNPDFTYDQILFHVQEDGEKVFSVHFGNNRWGASGLDMDLYQQIKELYWDVISSIEESYVVDSDWAQDAIRIINGTE